jgi:hypothetical protein
MPPKKKSGNRCWPGYDPVTGKKKDSQGSCRPKSEKRLTANETSFRGAREKQIDRWQKSHPNTPRKAAQHLHPPRKPNAA